MSVRLGIGKSDRLSEQRLVKIGNEDFGCLWAPDILYDSRNGDYLLHWSSSHKSNDYGNKAIYYARTKDFQTFTAPEVLYRKEDLRGDRLRRL